MGNLNCLNEREMRVCSRKNSNRITIDQQFLGSEAPFCQRTQPNYASENENVKYDNFCNGQNNMNANSQTQSNENTFKNKHIQYLIKKYGAANKIDEEDSHFGFHTVLSDGQCSNLSSVQNLESAGNQQKKGIIEFIHEIAQLNPEGERIKLNSKVIFRHLSSELNLHSHFRYHEKGPKLQEVAVCNSKRVHPHDFWIPKMPQMFYEELQQSNKLWAKQEESLAQIMHAKLKNQENDKIKLSFNQNQEQEIDDCCCEKYEREEEVIDQELNPHIKDQIDQQCSEKYLGEKEHYLPRKLVSQRTFSTGCESPCREQESQKHQQSQYLISGDEVILEHFITQKELAISEDFSRAYCGDLGGNFQEKQAFNWKIIVHNNEGHVRDNSIVEIIHATSEKRLCVSKSRGILQHSFQVSLDKEPPQLNHFWLINRVCDYSDNGKDPQ